MADLICACCVITNREGSARNDVDIPIPEKYKLEDTSDIPRVLNCIYDAVDHYDDRVKDFAAYRERILGEKEQFEREIDWFIENI